MEQVSITTAYMWAIVIMVVFFLLAVIISNLIYLSRTIQGQRHAEYGSGCFASVLGLWVSLSTS